MPHSFDDNVRSAVLSHMNGDHSDDNLLIVRAFVDRAAVGATMIDFDGDGGTWDAADAAGGTTEVHVAWPGAPITERGEVRREVVALYDEACVRLGVEPRPHA
ncbi:hypothetical protein FHX48_002074 [Microbacterium halimionae]|uniref:DUF2470 domain-containing protein n=1 Tax=Microbacterium halimionae TaxID=1526413 RepID=A0A7W3JQ61_9MICO|nr:DUF2470 domain-containing protein [Microbacterium halimionae]MBA8816980.1 hypothetical protein [Microbacterium halimionae]NII94481.1 hypothetical protein [Microbacterium halimionae]